MTNRISTGLGARGTVFRVVKKANVPANIRTVIASAG